MFHNHSCNNVSRFRAIAYSLVIAMHSLKMVEWGVGETHEHEIAL